MGIKSIVHLLFFKKEKFETVSVKSSKKLSLTCFLFHLVLSSCFFAPITLSY